MNQFTNYVELQAEKAENLSFCRGIKLLHIRDKVETDLLEKVEYLKNTRCIVLSILTRC